MITRSFVFYCFCFLAVAIASGDEPQGPQWTSTSLEVRLDAYAKEVTARFEFLCESDMNLLRVKGDCGCIAIPLVKHSYKSGEEGEILVKVLNRGTPGRVTHEILVTFSTSKKPQLLTLKVENLSPILIDKKNHIWSEPTQVKELYVDLQSGGSLQLRMDSVARNNFEFFLEEIPVVSAVDRRSFKITLWMKVSTQSAIGILLLDLVESPIHYTQNIALVANLKAKPNE